MAYFVMTFIKIENKDKYFYQYHDNQSPEVWTKVISR
jgi:hypothetical protein